MFGSWNSKVRQMTVDIGKAEFQFVPRSAGYIKTTADGLPGPPVIVYNHREGITNKVQKQHRFPKSRNRFSGISYTCNIQGGPSGRIVGWVDFDL